jgi:PilZ domain
MGCTGQLTDSRPGTEFACEISMASQIKDVQSRRYVRVHGPFDAAHLDVPRTPVLIYDLNLGGGFVNFGADRPAGATLRLRIDLPREGPIIVNAEAVYRAESGVAVRFVELDRDSATRLARTIDALSERAL